MTPLVHRSRLVPSKNRECGIWFYWMGFKSIQLGFHIDLLMWNCEIHLPFFFVRIGLESKYDSAFSTTA
jgi:hypothetical protein